MREARYEHFSHGADVGVRGFGASPAEAFEQAALALTAAISEAFDARSRREAPGAYKDIHAVVEAAHRAGLPRKVARLAPVVCVKG